ncbi:MAG: CRISPR-associated protein Csx14 [Thermoplasmata archaeon]
MKTCVIAPMGTSPPVVSEYIDWLYRHNQYVNDVVIIDTQEKRVRASTEIVRIAFLEKFPDLRVHVHTLEYPDIDSTERNIEFMRVCAEIIKEEREKHNVERVILNVGGGRKNMCITLTLVGQLLGVNGAFHVVNKNVQDVNLTLEKMRKDIEDIYELTSDEEKLDRFRAKKEDFEHLLFPDESQYEIIQLPVIPLPPEVLGIIKTLLCEESDVELHAEMRRYKELLANAGLGYWERGRFRTEKFGEEIGKLL